MIGYDLDGVISEKYEIDKSFWDCDGKERKAFIFIKKFHYNNANVIIRPSEEFIIVTARTEKYRSITLNWLQKNNISPKDIFFMKDKRNKRNIINYKMDKIKELGVTTFYEDDETICKLLKKKIPALEIVKITPVIVKYKVKNFTHNTLQN
jgi:hypothetical protein